MKVGISFARPASSPRLAVLSGATLTVILSATLSACTGSPSSSVPAIFSPSGSSTATSSASGSASADASASRVGTASAHASASTTQATTSPDATTTTPSPATTTVSPSPAPTTTTYYYPTGAPATGGGGTAGLQDGLVIVLGGAAIAAGIGSLAYRRKFTRRR
jgi:hypothetical protein